MIVFDLACKCGVVFEGWFADRADFERQLESGLLACPDCGGGEVGKILSPVRTVKSGGVSAEPTGAALAAAPEGQAQALLQVVRQLVLDNFVDVGPELARESLKIHYGLSAPRNIRGGVTVAEEEMLAGEGIELLKIPLPGKPEEDA